MPHRVKDLTEFVADMLPSLRRINRTYDELITKIDSLEGKPLIQAAYLNDPDVVAFLEIGGRIAENVRLLSAP